MTNVSELSALLERIEKSFEFSVTANLIPNGASVIDFTHCYSVSSFSAKICVLMSGNAMVDSSHQKKKEKMPPQNR